MRVIPRWDFFPNTVRTIGLLAPNGPGERAGLKIGDRIIGVDGESNINWTWRSLQMATRDTVTLTVRRQGLPDRFDVTLARDAIVGIRRIVCITCVYQDRHADLWFGFSGVISGKGSDGLLRVDFRKVASGEPGAWRLFTEKDGLATSGSRTSILETRDGTIWKVCDTSHREGSA